MNEDQLARLIRAAWDEQPPSDLDRIVEEAQRREHAADAEYQSRHRSGWGLSPLTRISVLLLPPASRGRYAAEWAADLDWLEHRGKSLDRRRYLISVMIAAVVLRIAVWARPGWLASVAWGLSLGTLAFATLASRLLFGSDPWLSHLVATVITVLWVGLAAGLSEWLGRRPGYDESQRELDQDESS